MPNWCTNNVTLSHTDPNMISRAVKAVKSGNLLKEFISPPEDFDYENEWYSWNTDNWGVKWDVGDESSVDYYNEGNTTVTLYFDSAWCPPIEAYEKFEKLGFEIEAYYFEPGMSFCGKYNNGMDSYYDIHECNVDWINENIPDDIVDTLSIDSYYEDDEEDEFEDEEEE